MATRPPPMRRAPHRTWHGDLLVRSVGGVRLHRTRRALGYALAGYVVVLEAVTSVGGAHAPDGARLAWLPPVAVLVLAAAQAIPVGYFLAFANRRRRAAITASASGAVLGATLLGLAALGGSIVTPLVVVAAVVGAAMGSTAFLAIARTARERALNEAAVIAPDLPLVGGVYLLTPLVWLSASAAADTHGSEPPWAVIALGLYGASLLASARASRGAAGGGARGHATLAAGWFLLGSAPLWIAAPDTGLATVLAVACFAAAHGPLLGARGRERRMERPAVLRALPFLGLYLVLVALEPAATTAGAIALQWSWATFASLVSGGTIARLFAAGVALGHAAAELRGRDDAPAARTWAVVGPWVTAAITLVASGQAFGGEAEPWMAALAAGLLASLGAGGARLGVSIYALQRAHARAHSGEHARVRTLALGAAHARRDSRVKLLRSSAHVRRALPGIEA